MVAALIGVVSGLIIVLVGLLISMVFGLGKKVDLVKDGLTLKLDCDEYKEDMKVINLKLEGHDRKILRLQIAARVTDEIN